MKTLGRFELIAELGRGGMGVVYRARDPSLGREVALKVLLDPVADPDERARFLTEGRAAAAVLHPNVLPAHDLGVADGRLYMTSQFVPGGSLRDRLREVGRVSSAEAVGLCLALAEGLSALHAHGILHRDLKPENVLLAEDGRPLLTDFGLARILGRATRMTATGDLLGTPAYMAPEQAMGHPEALCPATDVYGLGVVLFELLTGTLPFQGRSTLELLDLIVTVPATSPGVHAPEVNPALEAICLRCLAKDPADRFTDAAALAEALRGWRPGQASSPGRRRGWIGLGLGVAGVALATAVIGYALGGSPKTDEGEELLPRPTFPPALICLSPIKATTYAKRVEMRVRAVGANGVFAIRAGSEVLGEFDLSPGKEATVEVPVEIGPNRPTLQMLLAGEPWGSGVTLDLTRLEAPEWFQKLRKPPPLPAGLAPTDEEGEYLNATDGSLLVWVAPGIAQLLDPFHPGRGLENLKEEERWRLRLPASRRRWIEVGQGFFIGKYEVTWAQVRAFREKTGRYRSAPAEEQAQAGDLPAHVDWLEAAAYCRWAGLRLPREAEWFLAAFGPDEPRRFPWGEAPPKQGSVNLRGFGPAGPAPVGGMPQDVSTSGCMDMGGNLREWVVELFAPLTAEGDPYGNTRRPESGRVAQFVLRGGSYDHRTPASSQERGGARGVPWLDIMQQGMCEPVKDIGFRVCLGADGRARAVQDLVWTLKAARHAVGGPHPHPAPPREDLWFQRAPPPRAWIDFDKFRGGFPQDRGEQGWKHLPSDGYYLEGQTTVDLPAGRWGVAIACDDGARMTWAPDGEPARLLIDRWVEQPVTMDVASFELAEPTRVQLAFQYCELIGGETLRLTVFPR